MEEGNGMGRKTWLSIAAVFLVGAGSAATAYGLAGASSGVTVASQPPADQVPRTRQALVAQWEKELAKADLKLPEGWEKMSTDQIRAQYIIQRRHNAGPLPTGPDYDPGFHNNPYG
jgi:hypothetical protein